MRKLIPVMGLVLIGCGVNPGKTPDPVDLSGKVTLAGKPVSDVSIFFQPTGPSGVPAEFPLINGGFKGKGTPGKFTYYFTEGKNASAFRAIPAKYKSGSMERQIDIGSDPVDLKLE
jgi:hypothetical protein